MTKTFHLVVATILATLSLSASAQAGLEQDLDGDGKDEIVWHNPTTGAVFLLKMNGLALSATSMYPSVTPPASGRITAIHVFGCFNCPNGPWPDPNAEICWSDTSSGTHYIRFLYPDPWPTSILPSPNIQQWIEQPNERFVALMHVGGDRVHHVFWNSSTGQVRLTWGRVDLGTAYVEPNTDWRVVAAGDFSGTGSSDQLLW